jgi:hypothetical protein
MPVSIRQANFGGRKMKLARILISISALSLLGGMPAVAAGDGVFLEAGKRLLLKTEGRKDYKPKIVTCSQSESGLCIRDTRGTPPDNSLALHADGLTVNFPAWKVTYIIHEDGTGRTFVAGKEANPFTWSMISE